ncbi:MAG TPA: hypothetical protein VFV33_24780, partial [Gemmatimonadaceae bacterium]|nr:hypothetical protein [Gemmatimonadaceae bacterium]
ERPAADEPVDLATVAPMRPMVAEPEAREAPSGPRLAESAPASVAPVGDELLARLRYQAQRHHARHPARIVARDIPPPRESRALWSFVRFVAIVLTVSAIIVVLAIVLRRAPTAPW